MSSPQSRRIEYTAEMRACSGTASGWKAVCPDWNIC
jgi:hypothetical protein